MVSVPVSPRGGGGDPRVAQTQSCARAGKRDPAACRGVLRSGRSPKMMYRLVCDLAGDGIPVSMTCRLLGFSKQAFDRWTTGPVTDREGDGAALVDAASELQC